MAGGSSPHSRIAANLITALGRRLDGKPCQTYTSDMLVHPPATDLFAYPDVSLVCGEEQFADREQDCLTDACLLAEVLSPSMHKYDREKFFHYQQMASLGHYLLIHQDRPWIEHFVRLDAGGEWLYRQVGHPADSTTGLKSSLILTSLGMEIPLTEIYRRISLVPFLPPTE